MAASGALHGLTCCSLKELYGSVSNDSRTLRGLKDLVPDLEKVVKLQYASASQFKSLCVISLSLKSNLLVFFAAQRKSNQLKRFAKSSDEYYCSLFVLCLCQLHRSNVGNVMWFNRRPWFDSSATGRNGCRRNSQLGIKMTVSRPVIIWHRQLLSRSLWNVLARKMRHNSNSINIQW